MNVRMESLAEKLGGIGSGEIRGSNCDLHGEYSSRRLFGDFWSKCPVCGEEEKARMQAEDDERRHQAWLERRENIITYSGIPDRFRTRTIEAYIAENQKQQAAKDFAEAYAKNLPEIVETGRSAFFIGRPGTGKTHLAAAIALHAIDLNYTVVFATVMRAIRRIKESWSKDSTESEAEAIASLTSPKLLILDEVGVQFGSETERLMMFEVLNDRYECRRPTLLLSNHTMQEVKAFLGERVYDRMKEDGAQAIVFDWESHRGK